MKRIYNVELHCKSLLLRLFYNCNKSSFFVININFTKASPNKSFSDFDHHFCPLTLFLSVFPIANATKFRKPGNIITGLLILVSKNALTDYCQIPGFDYSPPVGYSFLVGYPFDLDYSFSAYCLSSDGENSFLHY